MNKLKHLFAKPLISSNPKISPLTSDTIEQQETTKPEDLVTSQATEIARGRYLQKAHSSFPSKPTLRQKKNSLPLTIQKAPEKDTGFDFEQFEELVDKRKLGFHKELTNCGDDDKGGKAPRRHSWSAHDQGLSSKHNVEMMKKLKLPALNINQNPINNVNMIPSPSIRSPLNQSRVDESANLLGEAGENSRKEYVLSPADSFEEPKLNKRKSSMATVVSGGRRGSQKAPSLAQRGEFENLEVEISKEEKIPSNKENKMEALDPEDPVEDENRGEVEGENSEDQRDMFKRLSAKLALTQRFEKAEGAAGKIPSVNELESSDSNLDSLVEENPFEDEMTVRARTTSFKRLKTRLRDDKRYAKVKWTLFPDDLGRRIWDFVIGGALIYTALIMPVRVGFMTDDTDDYTWPAIDWSIDGIFLIDIIITFFTAYFDGEENLIIEKKKIFMHYLTGWFVLDILSVAPFYLISDLDESSQRLNNLVRVARLPRLYKLIKIIKLVRMIKIIKDRDKFMSYMNTILKLNAAYERLAVGVVFIFLFCHISACLWYLFVGLGDSADDWLTSNELDSIPKLDQYIASFYFVVQTMVTVGYGDLSPKTKEERLLSCFLMVIGVLFYSIFIGFVSSLISDMDAMNQKFNHKLHILHRLQKDYNLPVFFVKKLKKAIRFESKQTIDSKLFVDHLPKQLSVELFCVMHKDIIDSIAFLQNRPKAFIAALCPLLKPITINKRDTVFTEGDPADEIFFVKSGTVGYVLPKYKNECFLKIREGYFFGEIDLLFYGEIRKYTAVALKDCELYVLNKKEFKQLFLTSYREIGQALCENAYKRKQRTRKAYKEALKICQERHEDAAKHKKLRLTVTKRDKFAYDNSESDDSDDELPNALMGIVEEENEEEEEHIIEPTPEEEIEKIEEIVETQKTFGHGSGVSRLKAALMLKKAFAHKTGMRNSLISPKEVIKEEQKFGELNRKIDGLESKLGKLMSIGKRIKSSSFKDLNNPSVLAENPQKSSFGLSRLIQTPSNKGLLIQTDSSPTNSNTIESPLSTFRSPNALRRNLKKQGEVSGIKQFSSANRFGFASPSNAPEMDSERFNLFTGRSANREGTYGDVRTVANSEHDPMIITENNYEMREDDEVESRKTSGEEEKQAEKKEDSAPQPLLKLILNLGRKNAKIEKDDSFRTSASQFSPPEITKTKSGLQVEDF